MQTPSIMSTVSTSADIAADAGAGQGIRISGPVHSRTRETLFTSIMQRGFALSKAGGLAGSEAALPGVDNGGSEDGESVDVCGLLMQLALMNAQQQSTFGGSGQGAGEGDAVTCIDAVQTELAGTAMMEDAALQLEGQTASVLLSDGAAQLGAAAENTAAGASEQQNGTGQPGASGGEQTASTLAGITAALQNEAVSAAQGAGAQETSGLAQNQDAAAEGFRSMTDRADMASGQGVKNAAEATESKGAGKATVSLGVGVAATQENAASSGMSDGSAEYGENASGTGAEAPLRDKDRAKATGAAEIRPGFVAGSAAAAGETAAEKIAAAQKALNRLAEDLRSIKSGTQEIRIVLEPESLGVLTISVIKTETGVSAKIKSEDKEVAAAITEQMQRLILSMESKGIRLHDVDVVYSRADNGTGFQQQGSDRSGNQSSKGNYTQASDLNKDEEAQGGVFWQEFYGKEKTGDSAVEYRI